jgi:hypothetical protein
MKTCFLVFALAGVALSNSFADPQEIRSASEQDSWWTQAAAIFFPRHHTTPESTSQTSMAQSGPAGTTSTIAARTNRQLPRATRSM